MRVRDAVTGVLLDTFGWALATVTVTKEMLIVAALCNGFTYGKLFHQLKEIVSELLRYLWEIPSDAHQSFS